MTDPPASPGTVPIHEAQRIESNAYKNGALTERARVVVYLRRRNDSCCHAGDNLADDIERGDHA